MSNISIPRTDCRELLSVAEACASLGIRKTTFFKLAGERRIETVKLGRRTLVRVGELQRFIDALPIR
jgi:excisionase family DNA binding protein